MYIFTQQILYVHSSYIHMYTRMHIQAQVCACTLYIQIVILVSKFHHLGDELLIPECCLRYIFSLNIPNKKSNAANTRNYK